MKKGHSALLVIAVLSLFCLCLTASSGSAAEEKVITLKYSNFFPAPHANSVIADQWCKEVEKRTNGKIKVTYFPGATLTPPPQTYDSVVKGIADVGTSVMAYTRGKFPLSEVVDLPINLKSAVMATKMINELYKKFKPKEFDETQVMYLHAHGPGILHSKKPVNKLEDVKGLKIRSTGLSAKIVQALGGAPVGMSMNEAYDALSKGVADAILSPNEALKGYKLGEVTAFTTENYSTAYTSGFFVVMNKAKWNAIPKDLQAIIEKINQEWLEKQGKLWDDIDIEGKDVAIKQGMKYIALSAEESARWAKLMTPILDEYVKEAKAKGIPGDEALKFCQDYLKANQK
jgi:TRAP-type transport system periplasmic protein